jgi:hypothetical protein
MLIMLFLNFSDPAIARRIKSLKLSARVVYTPSVNCGGRVHLSKIVTKQKQPTTPVEETLVCENLKLTFEECLDWFLVALRNMANIRDFKIHINTTDISKSNGALPWVYLGSTQAEIAEVNV